MGADTPESLAASFVAALSDGDLEGALEMWDPDAAIVGADGAAVRGHAAIAEALGALIEHGADLDARVERIFQAGEVAIATGTLTINGREGSYSHQSRSLVVYRRGADGRWRIALDAPWGLPGG